LRILSFTGKLIYFNRINFFNRIDDLDFFYSQGSLTLNSPYQLSLLLYEHLSIQDNLQEGRPNGLTDTSDHNERLYNKLIFKCTLYNLIFECSSFLSDHVKLQGIIDELIELVRPSLFYEAKNDQKDRLVDDLSTSTRDFILDALHRCPPKAKPLLEIITTQNKGSQYMLLKVHLDAIMRLLDELGPENVKSVRKSSIQSGSGVPKNKNAHSTNTTLFQLLNMLSLYELDVTSLQADTVNDQTFESIALIQRCFTSICYRLNSIDGECNHLEEIYRHVYSSLLFDLSEGDQIEQQMASMSLSNEINTSGLLSKSVHVSSDSSYLFNLFGKVHYEIDRQHTISSTFNDHSYPILCLIKQYMVSTSAPANASEITKRESQFWRRLFLFACMENKLLLKSLIVIKNKPLLMNTKILNSFDCLDFFFNLRTNAC
jgi:hypothetical protein